MILGLDISTSCVGISIFNEDGTLMSLNYIKLKADSIFQKYDEFVNFMKENEFHKFLIKEIAIEEPLKAFKGKFTSADTIQRLTQMNAMISLWCYQTYELEPVYYNVQTARKTAFPDLKLPQKETNKKMKVWEKVVEAEPQINWIYSKRTAQLSKENFDMSDAYTVGRAHFAVLKKSKV
jgi:hypothetical protein